MKTITYAKNVFIPLTTACYNHCAYCQFKESAAEAKILSLPAIKKSLHQAKQAGCKEVLFTCGTKPDKISGFKEKLTTKTDFDSLFSLLLAACQQALDLGLLPHSNPGMINKGELAKLARYNASLGLMLETTAEVRAHSKSPTKQPKLRQQIIAQAGQLKIPFTSGLLLGIGETKSDRIASLRVLKDLQLTYGHLQEVILQPVDPPKDSQLEPPQLEVLLTTLELAREILPPEVALQVPPNLVNLQKINLKAIDDIGGISPLTDDYINPNHDWPEINHLQNKFPKINFKERLSVYPQFLTVDWLSPPVWNCLQSEGWLDEYST